MAGDSTRSIPTDELLRTIGEIWPIEPADPAYLGEVAGPLAVCRRRRRVRRDLVGDPAVLPRLHARADLGRGQALHVPFRGPGPRPQGAVARRRERCRPGGRHRRHLDASDGPLLGDPVGGDVHAAEDRDVRDGRLIALVHRLSTARVDWWTAVDRLVLTSWITALTPRPAGP